MDNHWIYQYLPKIFCVLAFIINPIFVYLIFTEKKAKLGNYRYLLLYFSIFNLVYSLGNVFIPLDIHSYRYCFFVFIDNGWFVELSDFNTHMLAVRCSLVVSSYAVLLSHFVYRYLVIHNSSLTREKFHFYMTGSIFVNVAYYLSWHWITYYFGRVNLEMRQYIRKEFWDVYKMDSMDFNMGGAVFQESSEAIIIRSWTATSLWTLISVTSIVTFLVLAKLIIQKLRKATSSLSKKTSRFQVELLRALVVQTVIPIFVSFAPCVLSWYSPMFGIQLAREFNYYEVTALGVFAFVDPVAIVLCIPAFRRRIFCR